VCSLVFPRFPPVASLGTTDALPCRSPASSSCSSLSSLELSDTHVYAPYIRALLGTDSHFCEVVVLKLSSPAPPAGLHLPRHPPSNRPGGNPWANLKSISHRCHPILVAFVWELTKEAIHLPLGCLQAGVRRSSWRSCEQEFPFPGNTLPHAPSVEPRGWLHCMGKQIVCVDPAPEKT